MPRNHVMRQTRQTRPPRWEEAFTTLRRTLLLASLLLVLAATGRATAAEAPSAVDTLVVCPQPFRKALAPWLAYRAQQGHVVRVLDTHAESEAVRHDIRAAAKDGKIKSIVLVGDASAPGDSDPDASLRHVPTHQAKAKVNVHFGSEPTIATDNWYADLDDDDLPDVAIGRLTADSEEQLTTMVNKIIAYETDSENGAWRRKINVVAGVGGFGIIADSIIESSTKWFLTSSIPASYRVSMTYGNWRSPYCPVPRQFRAQTCQRLNEGCLFWIYIGHGRPRQLDFIRVPGRSYPVFMAEDVQRIDCQNGSPIAAFLSCYAGAYDFPRDCLGEELLRKPGGPVAVLASSRVALPYGLGVLGTGMLSECFAQRRGTLGEMLLQAKRQSMQEESSDVRRRMLDTISSAISPVQATPEEERREHLHLINLLGDPLLRIQQPKRIRVQAPRRATSGETIDVELDSPLAGNATVELIVRRDRLRIRPVPRQKYEVSAAALTEFDQTYRAANDPRLVSRQVQLNDGSTKLRMTIPAEASGECHVQVFLKTEDAFAMGNSNISIRRPVQSEKTEESPNARPLPVRSTQD